MSSSDRDRFDLDELAGVAESRHAQQDARGVVVAEGIADDLPGSYKVGRDAHGRHHGRACAVINSASAGD